MIDLLHITNDPALAARLDALPGMRIFLDLERNGKAERQAGRNTFISEHQLEDIGPVKAALRQTRLMVRVNPLFDGTAAEVDAVLARGADLLMLPMFHRPDELARFAQLVAGRCPIVALVETRGALESIARWIGTPGLWEVFVGLNDLHLSLGCSFMFEPLALGHVDAVALAARRHGLRFGFGGIARLDQGMLPGRAVLGEHVRLGSQAVILSRTFREAEDGSPMEAQLAALRAAEAALGSRSAAQVEEDRLKVRAAIAQTAIELRAGR